MPLKKSCGMNTLAGEGQGPGPLWDIGKTGTFVGSEGLPLPRDRGLRTCLCLYLHLVSLLSWGQEGEGSGPGVPLLRGGKLNSESPSLCPGPAFLTITPQLPEGRSGRQEGLFLAYPWVWFVFEELISAL